MKEIENSKYNPEIETEDLGNQTITKPFIPSKIRIDQQNVNLGLIIEMLKFEEINLMPDFQRKAGLWSDKQKSQLIESVLLGLPLPSFYFSVDSLTNKWVVVDGLQRLSTFKSFIIDKTLILDGLEFLEQYKGKNYDKLSREDIRKISGFKINLYLIDKETPHNVKFLIFKRVNSGGLDLEPQEMRHALNQGKPAEFIKKMSNLDEFKFATENKIRTDRQEDRDFANRFVAFYLLGYENKYEGELDTFLNTGMALLNEKSENELNDIMAAFRNAMTLSLEIFGKNTFRKMYSNENRRNPISKSVFDTISVNLAWLSMEEQQIIKSKSNIFIEKLLKLFDDKDSDFHRSITTGTGQKTSVFFRFSTIKNLLKEIIENDKKI